MRSYWSGVDEKGGDATTSLPRLWPDLGVTGFNEHPPRGAERCHCIFFLLLLLLLTP